MKEVLRIHAVTGLYDAVCGEDKKSYVRSGYCCLWHPFPLICGMIAFTMLSVILLGLYDASCRVPAVLLKSAFLLAGLCRSAVCFSFVCDSLSPCFLNTLFAQKVTANMLGSALAVLASIIWVAFYEVAHGGGILIPLHPCLTKAVLQLSESLEAGADSTGRGASGFCFVVGKCLVYCDTLVQWMHKTAAD